MAIAGRRLGIDPAELARRNLVREDEFPYRTPSGGLYDSGDYTACLERSLELARYDDRRDEQAAAREAGRLVGIGIACVVEPSISNMGYITLAQTAAERAETLPKSGNAEGATVSINPLGGITVRMATTPQGQGHRTVAAQVVGDVLGWIRPTSTSSPSWTRGRMRGRSPRATTRLDSRASGPAPCYLAAQKVEAKLKAIAAAELGCPSEEVRLRDGKAWDGESSVSLRRLAGIAHWNPAALPDGIEPGLHETAFYATPNLEPPDEEDRVASSAAHGFLVDVAVVEVERETGAVHVLDYVSVHDAGRLLNPLIVEGQVRGGFAHGVGAALFERLVYDEDGNLVTGTFMDYLCPTARRHAVAEDRSTSRPRRRSRRSARRGSARERR